MGGGAGVGQLKEVIKGRGTTSYNDKKSATTKLNSI